MSNGEHKIESVYGIIGNRRIPDRASRGLRQCPYCPSRINASHFPLHLVKCRKRDPKKSEKFGVCKYDYSHHILIEDMEEHLQKCPARNAFVFREIRSGNGTLEDQVTELKAELLTMEPELERRKRQMRLKAERKQERIVSPNKKKLDDEKNKTSQSQTHGGDTNSVNKNCDLSINNNSKQNETGSKSSASNSTGLHLVDPQKLLEFKDLTKPETENGENHCIKGEYKCDLQQPSYFQLIKSSVRNYFNV